MQVSVPLVKLGRPVIVINKEHDFSVFHADIIMVIIVKSNPLHGKNFMLPFECLYNNQIGVTVVGDVASRGVRLPRSRQRLDSVPPGVVEKRSPRQSGRAAAADAMLLSTFLFLRILNMAAAQLITSKG